MLHRRFARTHETLSAMSLFPRARMSTRVRQRLKPSRATNGQDHLVGGRPMLLRMLRRVFLLLAPWVTIVALWYGFRATGLVEASLIPTPAEIAAKFWTSLVHGNLLLNMYMSTQRVFIGVLLGTMCAVPVGFLLGWYETLRQFVDPLINFFRALPPIALIPLVIVYFGIGETAKIIILFYAAFFSSAIVMYEGIGQINPLYTRVARTLGATDWEIFTKVIIPLSVPHTLTALRVSLGVGWATLVAAELIAAQTGLGAIIENAASYFKLTTIYMGIICIGFIALLMDYGLRVLTRRLLDWQERVNQ